MTREHDTIGSLLFGLAGPVIWFMHFSAIYMLQSTLCALMPGMSDSVFGVTYAVLTVASLAALAVIWRRGQAQHDPKTAEERSSFAFLQTMAMLLAALSSLAIVWTAIGATALPTCT